MVAQMNTIRDAIADRLGSVSGVGRVHKTLRHLVNPTELSGAYVVDGVVNAWEIAYLDTPVNNYNSGIANEIHRVRQFRLIGIYGAKESESSSSGSTTASRITFENMVDDVLDEFSRIDMSYGVDTTRKNAYYMASQPEPARLIGIDERMVQVGQGQVLCHRAEIRVLVDTLGIAVNE